MSEYYLMAQLPSLDAVGERSPLPITEERFLELCNRFLGKRAANTVNLLTLSPRKDGKPCGNPLVDRWTEEERQLRRALERVRSEKRNLPCPDTEPLPDQLLETARTAAEMTDPLEAEVFLNRYRLRQLEELRPADGFSLSAVYYYGLKLKLMTRMSTFDPVRGEAEYRAIYHSIMGGEGETER